MNGPVANKEYVCKHLDIYDVKALKKYGQNFLIDDELANNIVDKINDGENKILLEIGPGLGALTYHLLNKKGQKILVEIDPVMVDHLTHQINDGNIEIINKDFLNINLDKYEKEIIVLGNLPYYVTTEIVEKLIKCKKVKSNDFDGTKRSLFPINFSK